MAAILFKTQHHWKSKQWGEIGIPNVFDSPNLTVQDEKPSHKSFLDVLVFKNSEGSLVQKNLLKRLFCFQRHLRLYYSSIVVRGCKRQYAPRGSQAKADFEPDKIAFKIDKY